MDVIKRLSTELEIPGSSITKVLKLMNEGATVPFIARYRKELTGGLDEVQLIEIKDRNQYWISFVARKESILKAIAEQGKLTDALTNKIESCETVNQLEDVYIPFKQKRKSKGQKAIEQGLKPLAVLIQRESRGAPIEDQAYRFVKGEISSVEEALDGAIHIVAEWISENQWVRERIRNQFDKYAVAVGKVKKGKKEEGEKFKDYFDFSERCNRITSHRILALFRGDNEGVLNFKVEIDKVIALEQIQRGLGRNFAQNTYSEKAIKESFKRILQPNFESEFKKKLKEKADVASIGVFASNLRQLLLQSPLGAKTILAIDPGFRTGCKVAVLNPQGDFIYSTTIFPHPPQNKTLESQEILKRLVSKYKVEAIAVGNGTAGLEAETLCRNTFKSTDVSVFLVNEAGASIYSASELAREEFGDLDLTIRSAISIGRRLMDPLAELVKIDAKSIGVGQYQHDVNQPLLKQKLTEVVETCVNHVGVELNTASYSILSYVSGLGPTIAKNIVQYRKEIGQFSSRKELLKVPKMGKKTFEQAAGFLRIEKGIQPLDNTIIHPESYSLVNEIAAFEGVSVEELIQNRKVNRDKVKPLAEQYGKLTIDFIVNELERPTIDPREPLKEVKRNSISSIEELYSGLKLTGTINNITNFGAFVNIGIKESGLVHISHLSDSYVSDIHSVVKLNQQVEVTVLSVDLDRKRIQLSMKS